MKKVLFRIGNALEGYREPEDTLDHPIALTEDATLHISDNGEGGIEIRAEAGQLIVSPRYANSVYISAKPLFPQPKKKKKSL